MVRLKIGVAVVVALLAACGSSGEDEPDICIGFTAPGRADTSACAAVDLAEPRKVAECLPGSGHAGLWTADSDGLPAYDLMIDHRCDPVGLHYTPRESARLDPVHLVGNGRGLVAMAHASGAVEIYSQDRGHKWINHVDTWRDPEDLDQPVQIGGGFNYVVAGDEVLSTRFDDLPVGEATEMQTRRFGVGYFETVTTYDQVIIDRRTYAPHTDARALVAEVTLTNPTDSNKRYGLVEMWDLNMFQLPVELATSDLLNPSVTETIDRRRRDLQREFRHHATYSEADEVAVMTTEALSLPSGVTDRSSRSEIDYFPEPVYLAVIDQGSAPDSVWLKDDELWGGDTKRPVPDRARDTRGGGDREIDLDGHRQRGILALRVTVDVPAGSSVTRRFAFGYVPGGGEPTDALAELRDKASDLRQETVEGWRDKLVWAVLPDVDGAGAVHREIAWASYNVLANVTYDEYHGVRVLGQGGAYKYIHGLDGAIGDLALFSEAVTLIDADVARDTLRYAFSTQHAGSEETPWRFPYATTGVGTYSDVALYSQRSDAYFLMPSATARYVALSRDSGFLDESVPYWPKSAGENATVMGHIERALEYANDNLGLGANGLVAMGTGDYADGVLELTEETTSPTGTSSTYNAGFVIHGFPLAADVFEPFNATLADNMRMLFGSQANALNNQAWNGKWYFRGFADNGNPLAPNMLFLEPQLFPILADIVTPERRDELLDLISSELETDIGAVSNRAEGDGSGGGLDQPQIGGVWPVVNAWLTEAYAKRDAGDAWSSFIRNTLSAHADAYPDIWYGVWTGPDSFNGPDHERAGEADAHLVTALTDYPALNAHVHTSPLRALMALVGVRGTADGITIDPRLPTETYSILWPRLEINSTPMSIGGSVTVSRTSTVVMRVLLPTGLRRDVAFYVSVKGGSVVEYTRTDDIVEFFLPGQAGVPVQWSIAPIAN